VFDKKENFASQKTGTGYIFSFRMNGETYIYEPALPGKHQGRNAAVAITVSQILGRRWKKLEKEKIIHAIQTTRWEGRLEVLSHEPLVLLDGAHNQEGAEALGAYIKEFAHSPVVLVYASMRDKKIVRIANSLFPLAQRIILTRFPYYRAMPPEELAEKVDLSDRKIICEKDAGKAFGMAKRLAGSRGTVVVAGSLFLIGEIKKMIRGPSSA
jgi:dihydrofolate synthase/folylpolyglutamate synthase